MVDLGHVDWGRHRRRLSFGTYWRRTFGTAVVPIAVGTLTVQRDLEPLPAILFVPALLAIGIGIVAAKLGYDRLRMWFGFAALFFILCAAGIWAWANFKNARNDRKNRGQ